MATVEVTSSNLGQILSEGIVILDFWADWCAPCRAFGPTFSQAAERHPDITFGKVDTEAQPALADHFGIRAIPTLMAFKDGVPVFEQPGALSLASLDRLIEALRTLDLTRVLSEAAAAAKAGAAR